MENISEYGSSSSALSEKTLFMSKTYGWMALGLLVSAFVAFVTASSIFNSAHQLTAFGKFLFGKGAVGIYVFAIAELALVWWLSASIRKLSVSVATVAFIGYSVLNGVTLSSILFVYQLGSIASCFIGCAFMFGAMSFYGATTKRDLTSWGKYLMMALIGVIVASLVQMLVGFITKSPMTVMDFILSLVSVVIFTGLTAYDTQKLATAAEYANGSDDYKKVSIIFALELYLDFINLFLNLLRIFGKRR